MSNETKENENKSFREKYLDDNGRFKKGNPGGPGRPEGQKNYLTLIEDALQKEADKAGKTYWEKLAEWCYTNPALAIAVLKKFVPDKQHTEVTGIESITFNINHQDEDYGTDEHNE